MKLPIKWCKEAMEEVEAMQAVCEAADEWDKARNGRELDMAYDRLIAALDKWREGER